MALMSAKLILKNPWFKHFEFRCYAQKYRYEIPETYKNAFYLANASLVDTTNWFVHNALGVIYQEIVEKLKGKGCTVPDAHRKISSVINILEPCNNFIDIQFPVKRANGVYEIFRGFRAEHGVNINKRPCLGGLRLCPKIEKSDIKALALISTYKYACMGIDMLGAHGGILVSPKDLKQEELQKVIEKYATQLINKGFCGESIDIIEPDMNCGSNEIKWIIAANSKATGAVGNTCAVGKPVSFGGVKNREKAVAQGIFYGLDLFLQNRDIMAKIGVEVGWCNKTFILQGLGTVGTATALYFEYAGLKCVGIIDHDCHIYVRKGLSIREAAMYKNQHGSLDGFKSYTKCDEPNKVLTADCDILLLAATQKSVSYYVADKVKAKIIIEAANGPMSPSVHKILVGHDKLILPDIYINSGSSIASYFEYLNNLQHSPNRIAKRYTNDIFVNLLRGTKETVTCNLPNHNNSDRNNVRHKMMLDSCEKNVVTEVIDGIMKQTYKDIIGTAELYKLGLDFRTAAYINAIEKLFWAAYMKT